MCGRFTRTTPVPVLASLFDFTAGPELAPHYNIAPTQQVAAVRLAAGSAQRELTLLRWGLIPSWADDAKIGNRLINARSEGIAAKPSFRSAFKQRRCLVIADGFYEWQKQGAAKQPYCIRRQDSQPFAFAGLWEHWNGGGDDPIESCTIITTSANDVLRPIHERMPVILSASDYQRWLDPQTAKPEIEELLVPCSPNGLTAFPVSTWVNNPRHNDPQCLEQA